MSGAGPTPTDEEHLVARYFAAFNRHDLDAVMDCFDDEAVVVDPAGTRTEGAAAIRARYQGEFAAFPDGVCDLLTVRGRDGHAVAESVFRATLPDGRTVRAAGTEAIELRSGRIVELRDSHH